MMKQQYVPFVQGIQDADADSADTQNGKIADAVNVHVHPERANILSVRPRFQFQTTLEPAGRVSSFGNRLSTIGGSTLSVYGDNGAYASSSTSARLFAVQDIVKSAVRGNDDIFAQAYAEQANGDNITVTSQGSSATGFRYYYQLQINGIRRQEVEIGSANAGIPGRVWAFARVAGAGFAIICTIGATVTLFYSTTNAGSFTSVAMSGVLFTGTSLFDAVQRPSGDFSYVHNDSSFMTVRSCSSVGVANGFTQQYITHTTPTYAGLVVISNTNVHVWHGGYATDGTNSVYAHFVNPTAAGFTSIGSVANPLTVATVSKITVGGGSIMVTSLTSGTGSYCYLTGGNGAYSRVARLMLANVATGTITFSTITAPILPLGRIWCDTTFFGARIWGSMASVIGCWELTPTNVASNTVVRCVPVAYTSVTGANLALDFGDPIRQYPIYTATNRSKCCIPSRDYSVQVVDIGLTDETLGNSVSASGMDVMLSAAPRYWDGIALVPAGIPQAPLISSTSVSPGTGTVPAGTYLYTMVWEWFDGFGRRQQSAAQIQTVVVAGASEVFLEIHPASLPYDERIIGTRPAIRGVMYRSDAGGTILKRGAVYLEFTTYGPTTGIYGTTQFTPSDNGSVSFATGEPLYMSAGGANELAATAIEETFLARSYSDRLIGVSRSFPEQLWYTKTIQVARGIEANQALYFRLPEPATGLAVQDGNIYWFTAKNCYAFVPQFADDTGQGGGGVDAVPLAAGVGCEAANSVVETPVGVFFIGPRGPWVIPRGGGAPQFVGADVEEFFRLFPTCRGSIYNPDFSEIVFAMEGASRSCLIIYNHISQVWYRWMIGDDVITSPANALVTSLQQGIAYAGGMLAVGCLGAGTGQVLHMVDDGSYTDATVAASRNVHPYIETKNYYPSGGPGEMYRANRVAFDCNAEATAKTITVSSSNDDGATWAAGYPLPVIAGYPVIYRFPIQKTRGARARFYTTWNGQSNPVLQDSAPLKINGTTLYYSPLGRAKAASPQYRG